MSKTVELIDKYRIEQGCGVEPGNLLESTEARRR